MAKDPITQTTLTEADILAIAYKDCELVGVDPNAKTPDGIFLRTAVRSVEHTVLAIEASGYRIVRVEQ